MSDEWLELTTFGYGDIKDNSGNSLTAITRITNGTNSVAPSISTYVDYILRDENGEAITDKNGDTLSLEGMTYAINY